ncbi:MAG: Plug domain-containing protein [Actinomycetota bacterium]|nr:Plug domain-containing protein [Actinomycetota bacterium]
MGTRIGLTARMGAVVLGYALLAACAGNAPATIGSSRFAPESDSERDRRAIHATVVDRGDIRDRGLLLDALTARVMNMRVSRNGTCPEVTFRGRGSLIGPSNPKVYVDGTRTTDTCVLTSMNARDVERVEVYPMGVTSRPGYFSHQGGLILVFTRRAGS